MGLLTNPGFNSGAAWTFSGDAGRAASPQQAVGSQDFDGWMARLSGVAGHLGGMRQSFVVHAEQTGAYYLQTFVYSATGGPNGIFCTVKLDGVAAVVGFGWFPFFFSGSWFAQFLGAAWPGALPGQTTFQLGPGTHSLEIVAQEDPAATNPDRSILLDNVDILYSAPSGGQTVDGAVVGPLPQKVRLTVARSSPARLTVGPGKKARCTIA